MVVTKPKQSILGRIVNELEGRKLRNVIEFSVYVMKCHRKPYVLQCFYTSHSVKYSGHAPFF